MAKTISDLNSVTSLADDNLMIVRQGAVDKKPQCHRLLTILNRSQ